MQGLIPTMPASTHAHRQAGTHAGIAKDEDNVCERRRRVRRQRWGLSTTSASADDRVAGVVVQSLKDAAA